MALHPQAEMLLAAGRELDLPRIETLDPATARRIFDSRTSHLTVPEVADVRDIDIPGPVGVIPARVYRPTPGAAEQPAIVFFHGGGWVIGSLDSYDVVCRALANTADAALVSVGYRLSPEHRYPAAVEDCLAAVRWVRANSSELGIDRRRIALAGDSAGGNLAAIVAQQVSADPGVAIAAQALVYPVTDLADPETASFERYHDDHALTADALRWFIDHYVPEATHRKEPTASPVLGPVGESPPTIVVLAECDPLRDDGHVYYEALLAAGVEAELVEFEGQIHTFFTQVGFVDDAQAAVDRIARFFRSRW